MANQKREKSSEFSESELDVARQLVQLSESNSGETPRRDKDDDGTNEACSAATEAGAAGVGEDGEDCYELERKTRKFGSIQQIYRSTKPLFPRTKKMRYIQP